jgi:hypothetical protein
MGIPEAKRPIGRPRRRWEENIKIDIKKILDQSVEGS